MKKTEQRLDEIADNTALIPDIHRHLTRPKRSSRGVTSVETSPAHVPEQITETDFPDDGLIEAIEASTEAITRAIEGIEAGGTQVITTDNSQRVVSYHNEKQVPRGERDNKAHAAEVQLTSSSESQTNEADTQYRVDHSNSATTRSLLSSDSTVSSERDTKAVYQDAGYQQSTTGRSSTQSSESGSSDRITARKTTVSDDRQSSAEKHHSREKEKGTTSVEATQKGDSKKKTPSVVGQAALQSDKSSSSSSPMRGSDGRFLSKSERALEEAKTKKYRSGIIGLLSKSLDASNDIRRMSADGDATDAAGTAVGGAYWGAVKEMSDAVSDVRGSDLYSRIAAFEFGRESHSEQTERQSSKSADKASDSRSERSSSSGSEGNSDIVNARKANETTEVDRASTDSKATVTRDSDSRAHTVTQSQAESVTESVVDKITDNSDLVTQAGLAGDSTDVSQSGLSKIARARRAVDQADRHLADGNPSGELDVDSTAIESGINKQSIKGAEVKERGKKSTYVASDNTGNQSSIESTAKHENTSVFARDRDNQESKEAVSKSTNNSKQVDSSTRESHHEREVDSSTNNDGKETANNSSDSAGELLSGKTTIKDKNQKAEKTDSNTTFTDSSAVDSTASKMMGYHETVQDNRGGVDTAKSDKELISHTGAAHGGDNSKVRLESSEKTDSAIADNAYSSRVSTGRESMSSVFTNKSTSSDDGDHAATSSDNKTLAVEASAIVEDTKSTAIKSESVSGSEKPINASNTMVKNSGPWSDSPVKNKKHQRLAIQADLSTLGSEKVLSSIASTLETSAVDAQRRHVEIVEAIRNQGGESATSGLLSGLAAALAAKAGIRIPGMGGAGRMGGFGGAGGSPGKTTKAGQTVKAGKSGKTVSGATVGASGSAAKGGAIGKLGGIKGLGFLSAALSMAGIAANEMNEGLTRKEKTENNGAMAGRLGAGAIGAAIGTAILPGIGTVVGGLAGDYFFGDAASEIGKEAGSWFHSADLSSVSGLIESKASAAFEGFKASEIGQLMSLQVNTILGGLSLASGAITGNFSKAISGFSDWVNVVKSIDVSSSIATLFGSMEKGVKQVISDFKETAVGKFASSVIDGASDLASNTVDTVKESSAGKFMSSAIEEIQNSSAGRFVSSSISQAKNTTSSAFDAAKNSSLVKSIGSGFNRFTGWFSKEGSSSKHSDASTSNQVSSANDTSASSIELKKESQSGNQTINDSVNQSSVSKKSITDSSTDSARIKRGSLNAETERSKSVSDTATDTATARSESIETEKKTDSALSFLKDIRDKTIETFTDISKAIDKKLSGDEVSSTASGSSNLFNSIGSLLHKTIGSAGVEKAHSTVSDIQSRNKKRPKPSRKKSKRWDSVKGDIVGAADVAGVDAGVLAAIANFESGFDVDARPIARKRSRNKVTQFDGVKAISSGHGLGQFLDGTWNDMINRHGKKYGIENAGKLGRKETNRYRTDQRLQAAMLAEFTKENVVKGRRYGGADDMANVYAMHNLGGGDGAKFLKALKANPSQRIDQVLSQRVIKGNGSLYGKGNITVEEAYKRMSEKMANGSRYAEEARIAQKGLPINQHLAVNKSVNTAQSVTATPDRPAPQASVKPTKQPVSGSNPVQANPPSYTANTSQQGISSALVAKALEQGSMKANINQIRNAEQSKKPEERQPGGNNVAAHIPDDIEDAYWLRISRGATLTT